MYKNFIKFLRGKKTTIATLINLGVTISLIHNWINSDDAMAINGALAILGVTANVSDSVIRKRDAKDVSVIGKPSS